MFVRLTAESQSAGQDPDGGSHSVAQGTFHWCHVAVAQLSAVTYFHWRAERKEQHKHETGVILYLYKTDNV